MIFYLLRHAKSFANSSRLVTGTPSDTLCLEGQDQSKLMKAWWEKSGFVADRYFVSQWRRARETAELILPDVDWTIDERLGETNAGSVSNWELEKFLEEYPDFYANPENYYPGGESHVSLRKRAVAWVEEQLNHPCNAVMVVAHSGPISCILQEVLGIAMEHFPAFVPAHASLSVIELRGSAKVWEGRLLGFSMGPAEGLPSSMYGDSGRRAS